MAVPPEIQSQRLSIVPFQEEFLTSKYVGWLNDPEVVRFSEQRHSEHTIETCRSYWQSLEGGPDFFWAIVGRQADLGHIGNITACVDVPNRVADIAILIGEKSAWGRGFGTEAWIAVCDHLLTEGQMRKVTAGTMAVNHAMRSVMRRSGMGEEGRRRRQFELDGAEVDLVYAARFADD